MSKASYGLFFQTTFHHHFYAKNRNLESSWSYYLFLNQITNFIIIACFESKKYAKIYIFPLFAHENIKYQPKFEKLKKFSLTAQSAQICKPISKTWSFDYTLTTTSFCPKSRNLLGRSHQVEVQYILEFSFSNEFCAKSGDFYIYQYGILIQDEILNFHLVLSTVTFFSQNLE